jgi:hypothetical protein
MSGNGPPFRVSVSGALRQEIRRLAKAASSMGIKGEFVWSFTSILQRLRHDPLVFGEDRFGTKTLNFKCRVGAIKPVAVHFAVHEQLHIVFVLRVFLMGSN